MGFGWPVTEFWKKLSANVFYLTIFYLLMKNLRFSNPGLALPCSSAQTELNSFSSFKQNTGFLIQNFPSGMPSNAFQVCHDIDFPPTPPRKPKGQPELLSNFPCRHLLCPFAPETWCKKKKSWESTDAFQFVIALCTARFTHLVSCLTLFDFLIFWSICG